jgi:hypothetical protein
MATEVTDRAGDSGARLARECELRDVTRAAA